jgi:hypothetical protein
MVQGAVPKKRNIKERTLVTFLKKKTKKHTHSFPLPSKVESGKSKESKSKNKKKKNVSNVLKVTK